MSVEFIITTNTKKLLQQGVCHDIYTSFLREKIVDLSGIIFQIFLKWKRNLSKKMISHFIKNRNWVALTPPNNMASSTSTTKNLEKLFPPLIITTFESWPPPPFQFYYTFIVYKICFWPVHLTFFNWLISVYYILNNLASITVVSIARKIGTTLCLYFSL